MCPPQVLPDLQIDPAERLNDFQEVGYARGNLA
jgi:hypothetical protein